MTLELDPQIRDWVLVPLTLVMVLIGVLRHFVARATHSDPKVDAKAQREGQAVLRARALRANAWAIPRRAFEMRRHYLCNPENGVLHVPEGQGGNQAAAAMLSDPNVAVDMMKKNLSMIVPQTLIFTWVNFFFSGFVAAKIPFPLTQKFRGLLQNGIDLSTVDVSYVSSRSWYFLNFLGLRSLFLLLLGEDNATDDAQRMMAMQMGAFGADPSKVLTAEKNALELQQHAWGVPTSEEKAVTILKEKLKTGHWVK